jgi:hypothetical protein
MKTWPQQVSWRSTSEHVADPGVGATGRRTPTSAQRTAQSQNANPPRPDHVTARENQPEQATRHSLSF